mmetsp:Transcript_29857/g.46818  ORF Transcript_29857/g.46818 Transcript_29857/m.46818 type:complete len:96 (+) Transcript_29857:1520-1807(+)
MRGRGAEGLRSCEGTVDLTNGEANQQGGARFGKIFSEPDKFTKGQCTPWARTQKPVSVSEVTFDVESRKKHLAGNERRRGEEQPRIRKVAGKRKE